LLAEDHGRQPAETGLGFSVAAASVLTGRTSVVSESTDEGLSSAICRGALPN
jgi:hypothetical protein